MSIFEDTDIVFGIAGLPGDAGVTTGWAGTTESRLTALENAGAITTYAALTDVDTTGLATGMLAVWDGSDWIVKQPWEVMGGFVVTVPLGDGTNVITSSEPPATFAVPGDCQLVGFEIEGDVSGSIILNTATAAGGSTSYSDIDGSFPVSLSSSQVRVVTTLVGWTQDLSAFDKVRTTVTGSPVSVKAVTVSYRFARTGV